MELYSRSKSENLKLFFNYSQTLEIRKIESARYMKRRREKGEERRKEEIVEKNTQKNQKGRNFKI